MALNEITDWDRDAAWWTRERAIALYIAVMAVFLTIAAISGANTAKDAANANMDVANSHLLFQAKSQQRISYQIAVDDLELTLLRPVGLTPAQRDRIQALVADYKARIEKLTSDPEEFQGMKQLMERVGEQEISRDTLLQKDPYFDYAQVLLMVAIVLAAVAIIGGGSWALLLSVALSVIGLAVLANGFTMAVDLELLMMAEWADIQEYLMFQARPTSAQFTPEG